MGSAQDTNIINCSAVADVVMTSAGNGAGIVGGGVEGGKLSGCSASGMVTATETRVYAGTKAGSIGIGGLAGCPFDTREVVDCIAEDVTIVVGEHSSMVGGLLGYSGIVNEGAFASDPEGFTCIRNCQAINVTITASAGASRIGGIVGSGFTGSNYIAYYPASSAIHIVGCTASGSIAADDGAMVGSILGYAFQNCAVVSCDGSALLGASSQVGAADAAQAVPLADIN